MVSHPVRVDRTTPHMSTHRLGRWPGTERKPHKPSRAGQKRTPQDSDGRVLLKYQALYLDPNIHLIRPLPRTVPIDDEAFFRASSSGAE